MKSYTRKAVVGVVSLFVMYAFSLLFGFAFRVLLARELTVGEYGLYYSLMSFFSIVFLFRDLGLYTSLVKFLPEWIVHKKDSEIKQAVILSLCYSTIVSILMILACYIFSGYISIHFFKESVTAQMLTLFVVAFAITTFEAFIGAIFQSYQRLVYYSSITIVKSGLLLLFAFIFLRYFKTVLAPTLGLLVSSLLIIFIYSPAIIRLIPWKAKTVWNRVSAKKFVWFGVQIFFTGLGGAILLNTDIIMLTFFKSTVEVGLYNAAIPIANLISYLGMALCTVFFPMFSEFIARKMHSKIEYALKELYKYSIALALPAVAIILTFPNIIIKTFFGADYVSASIALQILIWGIFINLIAMINYTFFNANNKPFTVTKIYFIGAILNLILNFFFIPKFGIIGAAITTTTCSAIMLIFNFWYLHKYLHIKIPWIQWIKNIVCCSAMILIIAFLKSIINLPVYFEAIIVLAVSGSIYLALLFMFKIIKIQEIKELIKRTVNETAVSD